LPLKSQLSDVYYHLLPSSLLSFSLSETKMNCENCSMSRPQHRGRYPYQKDLKCCTFQPFLPNFLVGKILQSQLPSADVVKHKILNDDFALPIGIIPSFSFQKQFNNKSLGEFGNRADWLCPYYNPTQQNCGIWQYRGTVCTSFVCKSSYGAKGLKFWESLSNYLHYVEMALMEESLVYLDFSPRQTNEMLALLNNEEREQLPQEKSKMIWTAAEVKNIGMVIIKIKSLFILNVRCLLIR
jgi:hypothetical protein